MIRLAWRQFRAQAIVAFGVLGVIAIVLAITGPHVVSVYDAYNASVAACKNCPNGVLTPFPLLQVALDALVLVVPALVGIFWGAPLVARELEAGTFRLAWTQGVTRTRWLATKFAVVGLSSMVVAGLLTLMVTWWISPVDTFNANRFSSAEFGLRGLVPIGYAAFAFALGVTVGVLIRRTLPAMAITLVGFVAVRLAMTYWVRPHLMSPIKISTALDLSGGLLSLSKNAAGVSLGLQNPNIANAWVYSNEIVNNAGHAPTTQVLERMCPNLPVFGALPANASSAITGVRRVAPVGGGPGYLQTCLVKLAVKYHEVVTYQPASRYWPFQWYEMAIFLAAALVLLGTCIWWVRRRLV